MIYKIYPQKKSLWIMSILLSSLILCSCTNSEEKEKGLYDLLKNRTAIFLTYRDVELPQEDFASLEKIIENLSFEEFKNQQYPGVRSICLTLKCKDREICVRLSDRAWSFWEKEKPIVRQYNGKLPAWRKYKSPEETKNIFDHVYYKIGEIILNAPERKID